MRDLVFLVIVVAFFALTVLFVRACELLVESRSVVEEERNR